MFKFETNLQVLNLQKPEKTRYKLLKCQRNFLTWIHDNLMKSRTSNFLSRCFFVFQKLSFKVPSPRSFNLQAAPCRSPVKIPTNFHPLNTFFTSISIFINVFMVLARHKLFLTNEKMLRTSSRHTRIQWTRSNLKWKISGKISS